MALQWKSLKPSPVAYSGPTDSLVIAKTPLRAYVWTNGKLSGLSPNPYAKEPARDHYHIELWSYFPVQVDLHIHSDAIESPTMQFLHEILKFLEFSTLSMITPACASYNFVGKMPSLPGNISTKLRRFIEKCYEKRASLILCTGDGTIRGAAVGWPPGWIYEPNGLATFNPDKFITNEVEPCTDVHTNVLDREGTNFDLRSSHKAESENKATREPAARENHGEVSELSKRAISNHSHKPTKGTGRLPQTSSRRPVATKGRVPATNRVSKSQQQYRPLRPKHATITATESKR